MMCCNLCLLRTLLAYFEEFDVIRPLRNDIRSQIDENLIFSFKSGLFLFTFQKNAFDNTLGMSNFVTKEIQIGMST